jgi:ankyrin repeat protein
MWASFAGRAEVVRVLIDAGATLNAKDDHGSTALTLASESGHKDVVQLLTSAGAIDCAKSAAVRQNGSGSRVVVTVEGKMSEAFGLSDSGFSAAEFQLQLTNWGGKTCSPCDKDIYDLVINAKTHLPPGFADGPSVNLGLCKSYIVQGIVSKGVGSIANDAITAVTIKCK